MSEGIHCNYVMCAMQITEEEGGMFGVQLLQMHSSGSVDLNNEVYTADIVSGNPISFSCSLYQDQKGEEGMKSLKDPAPSFPLSALKKDVRRPRGREVTLLGTGSLSCLDSMHCLITKLHVRSIAYLLINN
jgi:hypothetical protein